MKLTPWFPISINPVRKGVYEIKTPFFTCFSRWTGRYWCLTAGRIDAAAVQTEKSVDVYNLPNVQWRGVAK